MNKPLAMLWAAFMFLFVNADAQIPNWIWAKAIDGNANSAKMIFDPVGNIYITGFFGATCDFDPGPGVYNVASNGNHDVFILKLDAAGNFIWVKTFGGQRNDQGSSIALDAAQNIYISGHFADTVDFDPGPGIFNLITAPFGQDIFISKLDNAGNFIWAKSIGVPPTAEYIESIAIDTSGNLFATGTFVGTLDFDPGPGVFNMSAAGVTDIYILKLDSSGNFVWAKKMGGTNSDEGKSLVLDASGNIYSTGHFAQTCNFNPGGTYNMTTPGNNLDVYVSKLNSSGNFVWAKQLGGTNFEYGYAINIDNSGNIYTTGNFSGTADFDPGAGVFNLTATGIIDVFISKLDNAGNFKWAKRLGGTLDNYSYAIALDAKGNVYTCGFFKGTTDFDPGVGVYNLTSSGNRDVFISKLDSSGNFNWAIKAGGTSDEEGRSLAIDNSGFLYVTGISTSTSITFGSTTFSGSSRAFVCKLDTSTFITGYNETSINENALTLFPNPFKDEIKIQLKLNEPSEIILYDITSRKLLQQTFTNTTTLNTEPLAKGIYIYEVRNNKVAIQNGKVIKQ